MKPLKSLISLNEALSIIFDSINAIERTCEISINDALGRVIAEEVIANIIVPAFDRAAMDGYAVIAENTYNSNSTKLMIIDKIDAGFISSKILGMGECIQVSTGCKMPEGSDAVIMVENTELIDERTVNILKPTYPTQNVVKKGEDINQKDILLKKGAVLNPGKIGVLAAIGKETIIVYDKPKIAVISTGNEVVKLGEILKDGFVYDINSYTLSAIIKENGGEPIRFDIIRDEYDEIKNAIEKSLECDLAVFSGGSSAGEKDILCDVISEMGVVLFHGVQIKPGKPTLFGIVKGTLPILVMPGYPAAALSNGYRFLSPILQVLGRLGEKKSIKIKAKMGKQIRSTIGRSQFLTIRLEKGYAYPTFKASSAITSMSNAIGYIEIPVGTEIIEKDELVEVILI